MRLAHAIVGTATAWVCTGLLACTNGPPDDREVYARYQGVYSIERVDQYPNSCSPEGAGTQVESNTNLWVAVLTQDAQGSSLEGTGCKDVQFCQEVAARLKQGLPPPQGYYDYEHVVYSWVNLDGSPGGWGYLDSSTGNECHEDLEEFLVRREGNDTLFDVRTREGSTYAATASGGCDPAPEVDPGSLLRNRCLMYKVIRTRFVTAL